MGRYGSSRQTGIDREGVTGPTLESMEEEAVEREVLVERYAELLKDKYHTVFLQSKYNLEIANAITRYRKILLLEQFNGQILTSISLQQGTRPPLRGLSRQESNRAKLLGLDMLIDMIKEQYGL